jgi:outer membrane receptor protein involved in Fe transport
MTKNQPLHACLVALLILPLALFGANGKITGKITDAKTGVPLPGANIIIMGTSTGASTDMSGKFTINNVQAGSCEVKASYMGYDAASVIITVVEDKSISANLALQPTVLAGKAITITANRAVERESPIAFSEISSAQLSEKYTTGDLPQLIQNIPGVFVTSAGLGETEMTVRGFDADKVQVLINGIPVNDPESQTVYWSNWTGLSSGVQNVQVQRGPGSSLYGSGAFGGSLNIETMGISPKRSLQIRTSVGTYSTQGVKGGVNDGKVADGNGGFEKYSPINYNFSLRYNSGLLYDGKINFGLLFERKAGDSYVNGTYYDGYSFGAELQSILGNHTLALSLIAAPQKHNQTGTVQDLDLIKTLGKEYNRRNHPWQENYYFKPQLSLRHEWKISEKQEMMTNVFVTKGVGGGKYMYNDVFDVNTGKVDFKPLDDKKETTAFGQHARYIYETTGITLQGYDPATKKYDGVAVSSSKYYVSGASNSSWQNDSQNNHFQTGINTYYQHKLNNWLRMVVGGEGRFWRADHFAQSLNFRSADASNNLVLWDKVMRRYDYSTDVWNLAGFARFTIKPMEPLTLTADGQYGTYNSKVIENPVEIFDFGTGKFIGQSFRTTVDKKNADGTLKFKSSDYERTYNFFSPKFGANYNLTKQLNILANYSLAKKEPRSYEWYNRDNGPGTNQPGGENIVPETVQNMEVGMGLKTNPIRLNVNYYNMEYRDRIESVRDLSDVSQTLNVGKATFKGIEVAAVGNLGNFEYAGSVTMAQNRWKEIDKNVKTIFSEDPKNVVNKVIPKSPEKMANASAGYTFGPFKIGLGFSWWDEYYATYSNTYKLLDGTVKSAKLPSFFQVDGNLMYHFKVSKTNVRLRLDLFNLTNREQNYYRADYTRDYGRNDALNGKYIWYVLQAPLFNSFFTAEIML